jgi:predicted transcriptional regulator
MSFHEHSFAPSQGKPYIPPQVENLAWRERQVASIVYRRGYATAKDVELELLDKLSNGAIRSMLLRLVGKGILERRPGKRGAGCCDMYVAALSVDHARKCAVAKLADQFFQGSVTDLARFAATVASPAASTGR